MNTFRMSLSRRSLFALPALAALAVLPAAAQTEAFPTKAIRIIVPFAPGGSGDITARLVGKYIEDKTGQPFVVENKPGANGIVGALAVKAAPADGYTLMLATTSTNAANVHMYKSPGYDPEKDFAVVGIIGSSGAFLVVPENSPHKTLTDLGITLFQGYWFAKPVLVTGQTIRPSQAVIIQLINLVRKQATTIAT